MANSAYLKRSQPVANEEFNVHTLGMATVMAEAMTCNPELHA
jgi:hypothetical protein